MEETPSSIRLRFSTRETDLTIPDSVPVLIPTTFRRYQLSQYINSQIQTSKPVPLEFLINGTYLGTNLADFLANNGISSESTLDVEYVRAKIPPQFTASFEHDDWVSDVDVSTGNSILSASYDGRLRIWNQSGQVQATSPFGFSAAGHASFVKSAKFISPTSIVSGSFDRTIKLWGYAPNTGEGKGEETELIPKLDLYGHKSGVESVCAHEKSQRILSASSDHSVGFWSTKKSDAPAAPADVLPRAVTKEGKRRKLNPAVSVPQRGPLALMQSHNAPVMDARFDLKDETVGYSASMDRSVKTWDLTTYQLVDTRTTMSPLFCLQQMPELNLIAAGSAAREVKMVDPRASAATVVAMTLKGHRNHVVTLARDPRSEYGLASGSHDGTVRIWDLRSTQQDKDGVSSKSVYSVQRESLKGGPLPVTGEGVKVFGLCWNQTIGILSAGEDKAVQVNSSSDLS